MHLIDLCKSSENLPRKESTLENSTYPRITVGRDCRVCKLLAVLQAQLNEEKHLVVLHSQCSSGTEFCPLTDDQSEFSVGSWLPTILHWLFGIPNQ